MFVVACFSQYTDVRVALLLLSFFVCLFVFCLFASCCCFLLLLFVCLFVCFSPSLFRVSLPG